MSARLQTRPPPPRPRRRRTRFTRRGRLVIAAMALVAVQAVGVAALRVLEADRLLDDLLRRTPSSADQGSLVGAPRFGQDPAPHLLEAPDPSTPVMAEVRGLTLFVPARDPRAVAFHEASTPRALRMRPLGRCLRNANRTKFRPPPRGPGADYLVMSSRGRAHPATSAVDVAMASTSQVVAPVTGRVAEVRRYWLYGDNVDYRVALDPVDAPGLQVVLIHIDGVEVRRGDQVVAGATVLGSARVFPFHSQVNNHVGPGIPHVHLEVKARGR